MGLRQVACEGCLIEGGLEVVVVFGHGLLERRRVVGREKVSFPVEKKVLVLVVKDKIDEPFDVMGRVGIEKFNFWIEVFNLLKRKGVRGERGIECMVDKVKG